MVTAPVLASRRLWQSGQPRLGRSIVMPAAFASELIAVPSLGEVHRAQAWTGPGSFSATDTLNPKGPTVAPGPMDGISQATSFLSRSPKAEAPAGVPVTSTKLVPVGI